jgi:23S rRNA pseudouridine1911/1915/1917 synthase
VEKSLEILYEDNHLIAVNKRPGELVQGDKSGDVPLVERVKEYIKEKYDKPGAVFLGVTHRIDRPVSGVVLFARTSKALERINKMFREREIKKTYWAVVKNKLPRDSDKVVLHLVKNEKLNKSFASENPKSGYSESTLDYNLLSSSDNYHLLEINPHTGRHHQIRVTLSHLGCPIKGDLKYGFSRSNPDGSIHLHARALRFVHPVTGDFVFIEASLPKGDPVWQFFSEATGI